MFRKITPHVTIVLCNMYVVFYLIDRVNPAMEFITNNITKFLLLVMCILSTVNAALTIYDQRRRQKLLQRRRTAQQPRPAAQSRPTAAPSPYRRPENHSYAQTRSRSRFG